MNSDLQLVQTALTEIDLVAAGIAELTSRYKGMVYDVTTPEGMAEAQKARKAINSPIIKVEKIRKDGKAPILELGRKLDGEAKRITGELELLKRPIESQIDQQKAIEEANAQKERDRVAQITQCITDLHMTAGTMGGKSSADIQAKIAALQEFDLTEWADEFIVEAEKARAGAIAALQQLHAGALAQEQTAAAEAARIAQERAELAKLRAEQEERDRQADLIAKENAEADAKRRARIAEEERASREKIEAEERAARLAREEADRAARKEREAEEAKLKAERDRLEAIARAERQEQAARADAIGMLRMFVERHGKRPEFAPLVAWINKYQAAQKQAA